MTERMAERNIALGSPMARPWLPHSPEQAPTAGGKWLTLLCVSLLGYALLGKGYAYLGVPPVFIGEVMLVWGVVWLILSGCWRGIVDVPSFWLLLLMGMWGLGQTVPYLSRYGIEALRDAAIWGYSTFAVVVFAYLLARPARLATLIHWYSRFTRIFPAAAPIVWLIYRYYFPSLVPRWPWADVPVLLPKGGDIQVHLAGILAFWVVGFGGVISLWRVLLMACSLVIVGSYDRAGLLSFMAVFALCFVVKPLDRSLWRLVVIGFCGLLLLAVSGVRIKMPNRQREISFEQVIANFESVSGTSRAGDLDDTKEWRLNWWSDIIGYTLNGKYCWTGKGFGVNLADEDGYQVQEDLSLRSPHNGHMTMLARAGVPGLVLWLLVQLSWGCALARGYFRSRRAGDQDWAALFLFLLAYGMAFMINTSFDVFIEGPMGGIWYWTLYGVGLASLWLYKHDPAVLDCLRSCREERG